MYAVRPIMKTRYTESRAIVRKYMADYTNQSSAPSGIKGGFFAIIIKDTGEVWLGETKSFTSIITRFNSKAPSADCVHEAVKRGAELDLYLLTKPERFSAQQLENELWEADLLAGRKVRNMQGPGKLYVVRHNSSMDYFVLANRKGCAPSTILSNFLTRLNNQSGGTRNKQLDEFITMQADDIIRGTGFSITHVDDFKTRDDESLKRQVYIDSCKFGRSLNYMFVE